MSDTNASVIRRLVRALLLMLFVCAPCVSRGGADAPRSLRPEDYRGRLQGFDKYVQDVLRDWNVPGIGVGIVVNDKLVLAKGYGYRDYARKLPFTPKTLFPIGSNTKLFTAIAAGLFVRDGALTYDRPIRESEHSIQFYSDALNDSVTLRDMLAHRTGISRHDTVWYKTDRSAADLYSRLRFLEPASPPREKFLYNNMMYAAIGRIIEIKSGGSYPQFIRTQILQPLEMGATVFTLQDMQASADYALPYDEHRDSHQLFQMPYYDDLVGLQSAGAMISNIEDLSHWLMALMNEGRYKDRQVLPASVVTETLVPALALPNPDGTTWTGWDLLNTTYGMARFISVYRGHLLAYHGGHIDGYRAQISSMPREHMGVIVLVMGEHTGFLYDAISYAAYERLLGLSLSSGASRLLALRNQSIEAARTARQSAAADRVAGTHPSHALADFVGDYENPAYGVLQIHLTEGRLQYALNHVRHPLNHFHYDRFDTDDDELDGKQSVNFGTSPQGDVDNATISLDEAQAVFTRRAPALSMDLLNRLTGHYERSGGMVVDIELRDGKLYGVSAGNPDMSLIPYRELQFRLAEFADTRIEFVEEQGRVTGFRQRSPHGDYLYERR